MADTKIFSQMIQTAIRNDLACNGPMAQQMANIFGLRRSGSGRGIDVTTLNDADKKIISIEDLEMSKVTSAQTVHDAIKEKVKRETWIKLMVELDEKQLKNVIRSGLDSGDIVIQGDIFGIEEQISKEIMLSNRFVKQAN